MAVIVNNMISLFIPKLNISETNQVVFLLQFKIAQLSKKRDSRAILIAVVFI